MLDLKVDPKLPFHFLVGVETRNLHSGKHAGEFRMKYLVKFTNEEVSNVRDAIRLSQDKLFPTKPHEATNVTGCTGLVSAISGMMLAADFNHVTVHHFSSVFEWEEDDIEMFVNTANLSVSTKQKLIDAKISRGHHGHT